MFFFGSIVLRIRTKLLVAQSSVSRVQSTANQTAGNDTNVLSLRINVIKSAEDMAWFTSDFEDVSIDQVCP